MKRKMIFWSLACCPVWMNSAYAKPNTAAVGKTVSSKQQRKTEWPLIGLTLPVRAADIGGDGGVRDVLNWDWHDIAAVLEVPELRVRYWPQANNFVGAQERVEKRTIKALRKHGYEIEKWEYQESGLWGINRIPGFDAIRGRTRYSAMWLWNGSYLMLYWGKPKPSKPAK